MSKKRIKDRLRHIPNYKVRKKRQSEKSAVKTADCTRRNLFKVGVKAGIVAAIGGLIGYNVFKGDKENPEKPARVQEAPKLTPDPQPIRPPKIPEYHEWENRVELPSFKLESEPMNWNFGERLNYYLPQNIGVKKVKELFGRLEKIQEKSLQDLKNTSNPDERYAIIKDFAEKLQKLYFISIGEPEREFSKDGDDVNRFLLVNNLLLHGYKNIAIFNVEKTYNATVSAGSKKRKLPINFIKKNHDFLIIPGYMPVQYFAKHVRKGDYTVIEEDSLQKILKGNLKALEKSYKRLGIKMKEIDRDALLKTHLNEVVAHECMHAVLHLMGIDSKGNDAIKPKGMINMGRFVLRQNEYSEFNNTQLHELAALGYGLLNSGDLAPLGIWTAVVPSEPNYKFANFIATGGIVHSPSIGGDLKQKLLSGNISSDNLSLAISKLPNKELHQIGEQMVKLAIYLTQE